MYNQKIQHYLQDASSHQRFVLLNEVTHTHPYCSLIGETASYCMEFLAIRDLDKKSCLVKWNMVGPTYPLSHELENEIRMLSYLNHDNIMKPLKIGKGFIYSSDKDGSKKNYGRVVYIAGEYLFNISSIFSNEAVCWPEEFIKNTMRKLALAVYYLHCQGLVHSNLRLENILFNQQWDVKLSGLELISRDSGFPCYSACCIEPYSAPEMYTAAFPIGYLPMKADIYSLGIIFLALRVGYLPPIEPYTLQSPHNRRDVFQDEKYWICLEIMSKVKLDNGCHDLLKSMLTSNATQRFNIEQVLIHSYLAMNEDEDEIISDYPTHA